MQGRFLAMVFGGFGAGCKFFFRRHAFPLARLFGASLGFSPLQVLPQGRGQAFGPILRLFGPADS